MPQSKKVGRNSNSCKQYAASKRREHNKIITLKRHLKFFPLDKNAEERLSHYKLLVTGSTAPKRLAA